MNKAELDHLAEKVIGLAIEVHRTLGPGLLESVYESALAHELASLGLKFEKQKVDPNLTKYLRASAANFSIQNLKQT